MDAAAANFLESATHRTLHAHNFSRSSTEASHVLTDLLARYFALLSTTCARYAEHAGRSTIAVSDAVRALDELGTGVDDLNEFMEVEGRELQRYSSHTARRAEELGAMKETLADGLRIDRDDSVHLVYAPYSGPSTTDSDGEEDDDEEDEVSDEEMDIMMSSIPDIPNGQAVTNGRRSPRSLSPVLPPSPISRPSSPPRKRARNFNWKPESHIPDFLPPYPTSSPPPSPRFNAEMETTTLPSEAQNRPITPPPQLASSTTASDYLTAVPFSMSALAGHEHHLPEFPDMSKRSTVAPPKRALPSTAQTLVHAYHYVLTNPPPAQPTINPLRHKIAMSLLAQMYTSPRWTAADTLFANLAPSRPRVLAPAPSHPVPLKEVTAEADGGKDKRLQMIPSALSKSIVPVESLLPLSTQPMSKIPDISRSVLLPAVYTRATRLTAPPMQTSGNEKFLFGEGVPAPWNGSEAAGKSSRKKEPVNGQSGESSTVSEEKSEALPDARLYATWSWDEKDFRAPLTQPKGRRATGSFSVAPGTGGSLNGLPHLPSITIPVRSGSMGAESSVPRKNSKFVIKPPADAIGKGK